MMEQSTSLEFFNSSQASSSSMGSYWNWYGNLNSAISNGISGVSINTSLGNDQ